MQAKMEAAEQECNMLQDEAEAARSNAAALAHKVQAYEAKARRHEDPGELERENHELKTQIEALESFRQEASRAWEKSEHSMALSQKVR